MKKTIKYSLLILAIAFVSCEIGDFDLQDNPNELTPNSADPNFVLNEVQVLFAESMSGFGDATDKVMRYITMNGTYNDMADQGALNSEWSEVYEIAQNVAIIEKIAESKPEFSFHRGIAKILKAYAMATLVDYLGDVPFSEANNPSNFNPKLDDDETIYNSLLADIELAIQDINAGTVAPLTDMYYKSNKDSWVKLANSLKLKMYLNMGNAAAVNNLINSGELISDKNEDFQFAYSTATNPEDSRHPYYNDASYGADDFSSYIGNYFIWLLKDSKSIQDPRLRYYLYRQIGINPQDDTSGNFLRCQGDPIFDFCYVGDFYWGRDHGDNNSRPADGFKKTTYGLYPIGGAFDADNFVPANKTNNLGGAGILPILLASNVNFLQAEAVLSLGATGNARTFLEKGIRASTDKVLNFGTSLVSSGFEATPQDVDDYVNLVLSEFDAAGSNNAKLDIVLREAYISNFGNSYESYNGYRRTGYPSNLQIPIQNESIPFPRTYSLPRDAVNRNSSINQRPTTNQVFWDTNPAGFIN